MSVRQRRAVLVLFLLSAIGLGIASYLTSRHFLAARGGGRSVCSVSLTLNCDLVNTSEYSEVLGIPISALGGVLYLVILLWSGVGLAVWPKGSRSLIAHVTVAATLATAYSIFLAYISHDVLHHWCLFCIGLYSVNLGLWLTAALGAGIPPGEQLAVLRLGWGALRARRWLFASGVALACLLVGGITAYGLRVERVRRSRDDETLASWEKLTPVAVPIHGDEPTKGPAIAPVTIVEYFDFLCAHCKKAAPAVDRLLDEFPGQIELVVKHVPLDAACNSYVGDLHPGACVATTAALCAQQQGHYWEMHDWIFLMQGEIDGHSAPAKIDEIAGKIGLDRGALHACMASPAIFDRLHGEIDEAIRDLGIASTPTFLINGRGVESAVELPLFRRLIREALVLAAEPPVSR